MPSILLPNIIWGMTIMAVFSSSGTIMVNSMELKNNITDTCDIIMYLGYVTLTSKKDRASRNWPLGLWSRQDTKLLALLQAIPNNILQINREIDPKDGVKTSCIRWTSQMVFTVNLWLCQASWSLAYCLQNCQLCPSLVAPSGPAYSCCCTETKRDLANKGVRKNSCFSVHHLEAHVDAQGTCHWTHSASHRVLSKKTMEAPY